ncbi:MAG TPA: DUF1554 domain-containing protein [Labilithrix sp.]|jgi:hypothetical protein
MRIARAGFIVACALGTAVACAQFGSNDAPGAGPSDAMPASDATDEPSADAPSSACPACNSGFCTNGKCDPLVFVTKAVRLGGALGGPTGADALCREAAMAAGFKTSTFIAWLGFNSQDPATRGLVLVDRPYRRVDGTIVASGAAEIASGTLEAPIDLDEDGGTASATVWTNARPDGSLIAQSCTGWQTTDDAAVGGIGASNANDSTWAQHASGNTEVNAPCAAQARGIYCFEQVPP